MPVQNGKSYGRSREFLLNILSSDTHALNVPSRKSLKSWTINIALLLSVYFAVQAYQGRHTQQSGPAPDIQATDINGQNISLKQYQGKATLIYFWATWCNICSMTRSSIDNIAQDHPVITIASQSGTDDEIQAYQKHHQFDVAIINDKAGELSKTYGIHAFPTIFVLDVQGNISDVEIGFSSEWGLRLRLWWASG